MAVVVSRACWQAPLVRMNTRSLVDFSGLILRREGPRLSINPGVREFCHFPCGEHKLMTRLTCALISTN
jgi:hypothetical protein